MEHEAHQSVDHKEHGAHLNPWLLGGVAAVSAVTLAPYALPLIGIGDPGAVEGWMHYIGGHAAVGQYGSGLAGAMQGFMAGIPGIGGALTATEMVAIPGLGISLASGALLTLGLTAAIGIGGMLLANWMEKREDPNAKIKWSKLVRVASLATSALIALPSMLGAISVGIAFLAGLARPLWGWHAASGLSQTLGAPSMAMGGAATGLAALLPHFLTCGLPFLPVATAMFLGGKKPIQSTQQAQAELVSASPIRPGEPATLALRLIDGNGNPLSPDQLTTTFTEKLHTMVVDSSLTDYHHLHPTYQPATGLFTCSFTPRLNGRYAAWQDFTPNGAQAAVHRRIDLPASPGSFDLPPKLLPSSQAHAGNLAIAVNADTPLTAGQDGILRVRVTDKEGRAVSALEPVMGAYGHLAGFSADGQHFIHSHPLTELGQPLVNGELAFHITPTQAGMTKFFLQLQQDGQQVILPFVQPVRTPERAVARLETAPKHAHALHAMA